jgi:hypothetical protein
MMMGSLGKGRRAFLRTAGSANRACHGLGKDVVLCYGSHC